MKTPTPALAALAALAFTATAQAAPPDTAPPDGPRAAALVDDLAALRFDRLGDPVTRWDAIPPVQAPRERPHELLVVLVEFPDRRFDRFADDPAQGQKLAAWYREQLFDPDYTRPDTLSRYYRQQSMGLYHIQGTVLPPVTLTRPRAAYGAPVRPEGGDWRNDADPEALVTEALALAAATADIDPATYDRWDPHDIDGDGLYAEPDGYLDHLVLVIAGGGQSSCHGLHDLDDVYTPDAPRDVTATLDPAARECAERIWPHRFVLQRGEGDGPTVEGWPHRRGGVALRPDLWLRDYNIQSEYIDRSTFVHEFAHGLGLPDVYARATSNSTGPWSVMSATSDPEPQNLTAWSRIQLGWLRPAVIRPPAFGGRRVQSVYLRTLDDPLDPPDRARALQTAGVWRAALVALPPKTRHLTLTSLRKGSARALYSGQGNDLERAFELRVDLTAHQGPVRLAFDVWHDIEAGWDFAYLETSTDGRRWTRRLPVDRAVMPAAHGHDGKDTTPGFTGLSGDADGDGKNESNRGCDPKRKRAHGEDRMNADRDPCRAATWTRATFALDDLAGRPARIRLRYYTDMAAVNPGILVDDLELTAGPASLREDFEGALHPALRLDGFVQSPGHHTLVVPHYYLLEHRDPYAAGPDRPDRALAADNALRFYATPDGQMRAIRVRPRPGVLAWYVDGAHPWSENDPADLGPGRGFLLAVDATPDELALPGLEALLEGTPEAHDTRYADPTAHQAALAPAWRRTLCFVRNAGWRPAGLTCDRPTAGVDALTLDGRPLLYSYQRTGDHLPGSERERYISAGELLDDRTRDGRTTYRLRDRSLRHLHTYDAPFALRPFPDGVEHYVVRDGQLVRTGSAPHPAVSSFTDATPTRWQNPHLPFGGVQVPAEGFGFRLAEPRADAPKPARVKVYFTFDR